MPLPNKDIHGFHTLLVIFSRCVVRPPREAQLRQGRASGSSSSTNAPTISILLWPCRLWATLSEPDAETFLVSELYNAYIFIIYYYIYYLFFIYFLFILIWFIYYFDLFSFYYYNFWKEILVFCVVSLNNSNHLFIIFSILVMDLFL